MFIFNVKLGPLCSLRLKETSKARKLNIHN